MPKRDHMMKDVGRCYRLALMLAVVTVVYNVVEGLVSVALGIDDESLSLAGFGVDSIIEVVSGAGVAAMIRRIRRAPDSDRAPFERTALAITGWSFHALAASLVLMAAVTIATQHRPDTTIWGIVISVVSIITMIALIAGKTRAGRALDSPAILADAACTRVCVMMSIVLLLASAVHELTGFAHADTLGALGLAWLSFREGRECLFKRRTNAHCGCDDTHCAG